MNYFKYQQGELWLDIPEPNVKQFTYIDDYAEMIWGEKYDKAISDWNSRLHYPVSPELKNKLEGKDGLFENEFQLFECENCDGCGWHEGGRTLKTTCVCCKGVGVFAIALPDAKDDCSGHKKDLFGERDMKKVAEVIGDLHYEAMAELYNHLAEKHLNDHLKNKKDHPDEAAALIWMHHAVNKASCGAERAWKISKPYMK